MPLSFAFVVCAIALMFLANLATKVTRFSYGLIRKTLILALSDCQKKPENIFYKPRHFEAF